MELTGDFKKYYVRVKFKIVDVSGNNLKTEIVGHDILKEHVSRMVRRRSSRIDWVGIYETKDKKKIRVKVIVILPRKVTSSVKTIVRLKVKEYLEQTVPRLDLNTFYSSVVTDKIQVSIKKLCTKIYPVREVEIRKTEILG